MRTRLIILFTIVMAGKCMGQSVAGVTGIKDTSHNVYVEFQKIRKTHPQVSMVGQIPAGLVKEKRNIAYCKPAGRSLMLDVFCASKRKKRNRTAIIIIHGGGWRSGDRSMFHPMAQRLASMGYTCFTPEYRLSTEALYPAAIHDLKSAIRWVRGHAAEYDIDSNRIVVAGHSAGAQLAAFMGATNNMSSFEGAGCNLQVSSNANAVIDIDGTLAFIHPESGEGDDSKRISAGTHWFGYSKTENPELWRQAAPLTHAGKHNPPTLFLNSNVARMHAGRDDYIRILDQYKIYTEVKTFDAPHSFCLFEPWFTPTIKYMDDFIKKVFAKP
jgi:pectinesterase